MDTLVLHDVKMFARSDEDDEEVLPPSPEEVVSGDEFGVPEEGGGVEVGDDYQMDDDIENPDAY